MRATARVQRPLHLTRDRFVGRAISARFLRLGAGAGLWRCAAEFVGLDSIGKPVFAARAFFVEQVSCAADRVLFFVLFYGSERYAKATSANF